MVLSLLSSLNAGPAAEDSQKPAIAIDGTDAMGEAHHGGHIAGSGVANLVSSGARYRGLVARHHAGVAARSVCSFLISVPFPR